MSSFIHVTALARRSRALLALCLTALFVLFVIVPSSRAIHAASRVQAAQPPAAAAERRMMVLLFDLTSMTTEDVARALNASRAFVDEKVSNGDLVSVVTVSTRLNVLSDFTSDPADLRAALTSVASQNGTPNGPPLTTQPDSTADARLRAIRTVCQTIAPLQQRKSVMYFSGGMPTSGVAGDQTALNDATNTCRRANVSLYPVDTRGLAAVVGTPQGQGGAILFNGGQR